MFSARTAEVLQAAKDIAEVLNRTNLGPQARLSVLKIVIASESANEDLWVRAAMRECVKEGGKGLMAAMMGSARGVNLPPQALTPEEIAALAEDDDGAN